MKAGILTLQEADNYGAVLQAYALQTALMYLGVESEFIVFEREREKEGNDRNRAAGSKAFVRRLLENAEIRSGLFSDFRREYLKCSIPVSSQKADELNDKYDVFIAGSDQVWNLSIPEVDGRYFLPFVSPRKRFSYAASFGGNDIPAQAKSWCAQQLKKFNRISVREEQGCDTVRELTGHDSIVCADPVFLLNRDDWDKLTYKTEEEPYLLLYLIQYDKEAVDFAKRLAKEREVKVKIITASFMYACGISAWNSTGVTEWLSLIEGADCVITDSFHCCAFSMIFARPFSIVGLKEALTGRNGRISELLKRTGMEGCVGGEPGYISEEDFAACMSDLRKVSYDYLRMMAKAVC